MTVLHLSRHKFLLLVIGFQFFSGALQAQQIVDSCFTSIETLGFYLGSSDLQNVCMCNTPYTSSDLMEWNPESNEWIGKLPHNPTVDLPPPPTDGCRTRAIWIGNAWWTENGEGFALRLDAPLQAGSTYSFTFTYAADGYGSDGPFTPTVNTCNIPNLFFATPIDTLPAAYNAWTTNTSTFTATSKHQGHTWIIIHTKDYAGTFLSNCKNRIPVSGDLLPGDTVLCPGDKFLLNSKTNEDFQYSWNTGETDSTIEVSDPGAYSVSVSYHYCIETDEIKVDPIDCEVRLVMPNVFTPNGDDKNPRFVPINYNFIEQGTVRIFSRWGQEVFKGDLFEGWDGKIREDEAATGVYYYDAKYQDPRGQSYTTKGVVSVIK